MPAVIENLANVRSIPYLLAGVLGALAVLTVTHIVVTSVRNRRREVAVIRVLGADRRLIASAVHWQVTTFIALPLLIGAPLGLIAGQFVYRAFIDSVGAVDRASFPLLLVLAIVAGLLAVANLVAAAPAWSARRLALSAALRAD